MTPDPFTMTPCPPLGEALLSDWNAEWTRVRGASDPTLWTHTGDLWAGLGRPHRAAYARWRAGEAFLGQPGSRARAAEPLRTAYAQAAGHMPLRAAIEDLARRGRTDLTPDADPVRESAYPPATAGLTARELDVLRLVTAGRTNREIATELFISAKTASVHVTNIMRKLDVTSRVQAAAAAERRNLLG
jgi:DNA-binding CsgD family transcriptional regulator